MKYSVILAAAFAAVASAQATREDLPECSRQCIIDAVGSETDCTIDDISCSCVPENNAAIRAKATTCVITSCTDPADVSKTLEVSSQLCVGVPPPSEEPAPEEPAPEEPAPEEPAPEEPAPEEPAPEEPAPEEPAPEEPEVGAPETVYVTVCDSSSTKVPVVPAPTGNGTVTTPPAPTFTGAASKLGAGLGAVAAAALAAIAL